MSILNKTWNIKNSRYRDILKILLENRHIEDKEAFLNPDYNQLLDPFLMKGIKDGVERILKAQENKEKILIYGDYDVDGVTSSVLLKKTLDRLSLQSEVIIPDRIADGYGLNLKYLELFHNKGISLLITVDNGTTAIKEINAISKSGIDVIVIDHHQPHNILPNAIIINPLQKNCAYPEKILCGVGIVYKFISALYKFIPDKIDMAFLKWQLDLVALGTVADVAKLVGENRILTKYGLIVLAQTQKQGLKTLMQIAGIKTLPTSLDIGFKLGPRLNASGRIANALISFELLYSEDLNITSGHTFKLQELNLKRQTLVQDMMIEAYSLLDNTKKYIAIKKDHWHPGVIGLLASSLAHEFQKPVFAMCKNPESGEIIGSVRTPDIKLDIMKAMHKAKEYYLNYGGHKSAAGFKIHETDLSSLIKSLDEFFESEAIAQELEVNLEIDAIIESTELTVENIERLNCLEPYGEGNKEPLFVLENVIITKTSLVGDKKNHLKINLSATNQSFNAIAFGFGKYYDQIEQLCKEKKLVAIAFKPTINEWNDNKKLDLQILDIRNNI
jgi:single-stranded-DNA-specific exonuclease